MLEQISRGPTTAVHNIAVGCRFQLHYSAGLVQ